MGAIQKTEAHAIEQRVPSVEGLERVLLEGDLSKLSEQQRMHYYQRVCESTGLNPLTQPFEYLRLQGKLILYAKRACTDQLRQIHRVSVRIVERSTHDGVYVVTAQATLPDGRTDESTGVVPLGNAKGEALANALMKAETKAKRRVTLSICGLSMLDESELDGVRDRVTRVEPQQLPPEQPREEHDPETGEVIWRIPQGEHRGKCVTDSSIPRDYLRKVAGAIESKAKNGEALSDRERHIMETFTAEADRRKAAAKAAEKAEQARIDAAEREAIQAEAMEAEGEVVNGGLE